MYLTLPFGLLLLYTCLGWPSTTPNTTAHDFHVSKCLVEYRPLAATLQVSLHLFIDDMEAALRKAGADQLFLCTEREHELAEKHLTDYLLRHLSIEVDGSQLTPRFIGKEITDDLSGMWCYLEVEQVGQIRQLTLTNEILMDLFDDQKNIVNIIGPNNQTGMFLFQKGKSRDSVVFGP